MLAHLFPLLLKFVLIALCMLLHESGHIMVAWFFHVPVKKIGFSWLGVYVQRSRTAGWPEVAICLAGAAMNLTLACVFWDVSHWFALCNLMLGWVNLLPITHSDGSHAWDALRAMHQRVSI
jgi:Zn-dependent protease